MKLVLALAILSYISIAVVGYVIFVNNLAHISPNTFVGGTPHTLSPTFAIFYIAFLMVGVLLWSLFIIKFSKKITNINTAFLFSYFYIFFIGSWLIVNEAWAYFNPASYNMQVGNPILSFVLFSALVLITIVFYKKRVRFFNFIVFVTVVTYGVILGLFLPPLYALILLLVFSLYDFIAVFITKHMQKLVSVAFAGKDILPMMFIEGDKSRVLERVKNIDNVYSCKNCGYYPMEDKSGHSVCPICGREGNWDAKAKKFTPTFEGRKDFAKTEAFSKYRAEQPTILGGGDIMIPGALIGSLAIANSPLLIPAVVACGIGLGADMLWLIKSKQTLPALPLIAVSVCVILGAIVFL